MKAIWIDVSRTSRESVHTACQAALHHGADAIVASDLDVLEDLPTSITRVYAPRPDDVPTVPRQACENTATSADKVLIPVTSREDLVQVEKDEGRRVVPYVRVDDHSSLELACTSATSMACTVVEFSDPTKIPLEIVIAASDKASGEVICVVSDRVEAEVVLDVLEQGADGLYLPTTDPAQIVEMAAAIQDCPPTLSLARLEVTDTEHIGLGDRVCVDTCSQFRSDEGILVGSFSHGYVLCSSETHPLPYMPTRPFRVNAGALHSYVLQDNNRTNYLSELKSGTPVLAVSVTGATRKLAIGRVKLERRPLLQIAATGPQGENICLSVQDDWHVRVLGPNGSVLNVTELNPGSEILGYTVTDARHVGYPVEEFCIER